MVELEEEALDTWMGERSAKRGTDQKTIGQPIVQGENDILNNSGRVGGNFGHLVFKRHGKYTRGLAIVNVGIGLTAELHRSSYGQKRERCHGVRYDSPFDRSPPAIGGANQSGHALEEHRDGNP